MCKEIRAGQYRSSLRVSHRAVPGTAYRAARTCGAGHPSHTALVLPVLTYLVLSFCQERSTVAVLRRDNAWLKAELQVLKHVTYMLMSHTR